MDKNLLQKKCSRLKSRVEEVKTTIKEIEEVKATMKEILESVDRLQADLCKANSSKLAFED